MKLTQAIVREFLDYYPETGELYWRQRNQEWFSDERACNVWNTRYAGTRAFTTKTAAGYPQGRMFDMLYYAHQIIWLGMKGKWPDTIDHENHNRADNRWCNLLEKTYQKNRQNNTMRSDNVSGKTGVFWITKRGHWVATIVVKGTPVYLGSFHNFEAAVMVREQAERKYGFHPNHGK